MQKKKSIHRNTTKIGRSKMLIGPHSTPHITNQFAKFDQRFFVVSSTHTFRVPDNRSSHRENKIKHHSSQCRAHWLLRMHFTFIGLEHVPFGFGLVVNCLLELFLELAQRDNLFPSITNARINLLSLQWSGSPKNELQQRTQLNEINDVQSLVLKRLK